MPASLEQRTKNALVRNVRKCMKERDWNGADLARASRLSESMIYAILNGHRSPGIGTLAMLAHGLGVGPGELMEL